MIQRCMPHFDVSVGMKCSLRQPLEFSQNCRCQEVKCLVSSKKGSVCQSILMRVGCLLLAIIMSSTGSQRSEFQEEKRHLGNKTYLMIKN